MSSLPDKEFKVIVIKLLAELWMNIVKTLRDRKYKSTKQKLELNWKIH